MGNNNKKPTGVDNQPKAQPMRSPPNVQVIISFDPATKKIDLKTNTKDWDLISGMLIDGMGIAHRARITEKKQGIVVAQPQIILPGS